MPEYHAPPDDEDPTLSQMLSELGRLASTKEELYPKSEGWYTSIEIRRHNGHNMSNSDFRKRLEAARHAGRLEEQWDWRTTSPNYCRRYRVFRMTPAPENTDEG